MAVLRAMIAPDTGDGQVAASINDEGVQLIITRMRELREQMKVEQDTCPNLRDYGSDRRRDYEDAHSEWVKRQMDLDYELNRLARAKNSLLGHPVFGLAGNRI